MLEARYSNNEVCMGKFKSIVFAALCIGSLSACVAVAQQPKHPYYVHALSDLRTARAYLERPSTERVLDDEVRALEQIDAAIHELKVAAIEDGKNPARHPPIDTQLRRTDRFHKAMELLHSAREDCEHEEDDPAARGMRNRAIEHIEKAHHAVEHALMDA